MSNTATTSRTSVKMMDYTYHFDWLKDKNNHLVLSIVEQSPDLRQQHIRIPVRHLPQFKEAFKNAFLQWAERAQEVPANKAYDVNNIRKTYPNAYRPWTKEEDEELIYLYELGETKAYLGNHFGRQLGAINSRLAKLNLT